MAVPRELLITCISYFERNVVINHLISFLLWFLCWAPIAVGEPQMHNFLSPAWPVSLGFGFYAAENSRSSSEVPGFTQFSKIQRNATQMVCNYSLFHVGIPIPFLSWKKMPNLPNFFYISTKVLITFYRVTLLHFILLATQLVKKKKN